MINKNQAEASDNSVAAINSGKGNQTIDNSTKIYVGGLVNLASTVAGGIVFDPRVMREVIIEIDEILQTNEKAKADFDTIDIKEKNRLNGMSQDFYEEQILLKYEPFFPRLETFLKERLNADLGKRVESIAESLNRKIAVKRKAFDTFEEMLIELEAALLDKEYGTLQGKENTICFFLFYLYASCLIGKKTEKEKS
jgi:hypothetical protein